MARRKNAAEAVVRVVEPECDVQVDPVDAAPSPEQSPDLDTEAIDAAIRSRSVDFLAEVLTDIERVRDELETELAEVKASMGKRIKLVKARLSDVIHEIEGVTHEWVVVPEDGVAYLKSKLDGRVKKTRPLAQEEYTPELPGMGA